MLYLNAENKKDSVSMKNQSLAQSELIKGLESCLSSKDLQGGLRFAETLNNDYPNSPNGWFLTSCLMKSVGHAQALSAINRALALEPDNYQYMLHRARCLVESGNPSLAEQALDDMLQGKGANDIVFSKAGFLFSVLSRHEKAKQSFTVAVQKNPDNYQHYYNLATSYRFMGDTAKAEVQLDAALRLKPDDYESHSLRSGLRRQTSQSNHVDELKAAMKVEGLKPIAQVSLSFALAKELEDLERPEDSFRALQVGADTRRAHMQYDVRTDLEIIGAVREVFDERQCSDNRGACDDPSPIFIIGMPRTGTTLVERILGSHSQVHAAGELNSFAKVLMQQVKAHGLTPSSRAALVAATAQLSGKALGEAYVKDVEPSRKGSPRCIDKLPFNYLYAGLIHKALPNAKIIHLQRHPMDTCYAVYKQLFKDAYPFSYNLNELADYYIAYRELMDHWNKVMPGVIHNVNYEDVVADQEGESRRLLDYCDLEWEDACLDFHNNKEASTTASASQVRRKIYNSSVGKWRQYEGQLQPLCQRLKAGGIQLD